MLAVYLGSRISPKAGTHHQQQLQLYTVRFKLNKSVSCIAHSCIGRLDFPVVHVLQMIDNQQISAITGGTTYIGKRIIYRSVQVVQSMLFLQS